MSVATVLLDTNVFTAWLRPRSTLLPIYGKHVFGSRIAIAQQTAAEVRYGAIAAGSDKRRLEAVERLLHRSRVLPVDDQTTWACARLRHQCRVLGHPLQQKQHVGDLWIAAPRSDGSCPSSPTTPSSSTALTCSCSPDSHAPEPDVSPATGTQDQEDGTQLHPSVRQHRQSSHTCGPTPRTWACTWSSHVRSGRSADTTGSATAPPLVGASASAQS